ncbi:hypothetical protein EDB82DRAFT_528884 [Fusarium venenatum]|uniref:uncharacterized protein n=1 Tax=Fusarium venenatum TaxID=56646 RepID=UPI001D7243E4|nr:hypothetical protein EDB82DRAFT_528884 [Fusarium venenatum]
MKDATQQTEKVLPKVDNKERLFEFGPNRRQGVWTESALPATTVANKAGLGSGEARPASQDRPRRPIPQSKSRDSPTGGKQDRSMAKYGDDVRASHLGGRGREFDWDDEPAPQYGAYRRRRNNGNKNGNQNQDDNHDQRRRDCDNDDYRRMQRHQSNTMASPVTVRRSPEYEIPEQLEDNSINWATPLCLLWQVVKANWSMGFNT